MTKKARHQSHKESSTTRASADYAVPQSSHLGIPVVGIGGSAGSLEGFNTFFGTMPAESGAAFVVIQHLAPTHESLLAELLARHTSMRVTQAQDAMPVEPNCVYVIPPNYYLVIRREFFFSPNLSNVTISGCP